MNRRLMTILLPVAAAALTAGCTTFSDGNAVARVGDTELSFEELDQLLLDIGATPEDLDGVVPAEPVRQVITNWIQQTAIGVDDAAIADLYGQGFEAAGVACPTLLATSTVDEAEAAADRLRAGESFDAVFAETNVDPQIGSTAGRIGCLSIEQFPDEFRGEPDVVALFAVSVDEPVAVVEVQGATSLIGLVVGFRPFDDLTPDENNTVATAVRSAVAVDIDPAELDVYVDSRYGTFDVDTATVVPLG